MAGYGKIYHICDGKCSTGMAQDSTAAKSQNADTVFLSIDFSEKM